MTEPRWGVGEWKAERFIRCPICDKAERISDAWENVPDELIAVQHGETHTFWYIDKPDTSNEQDTAA